MFLKIILEIQRESRQNFDLLSSTEIVGCRLYQNRRFWGAIKICSIFCFIVFQIDSLLRNPDWRVEKINIPKLKFDLFCAYSSSIS